MIHLNEDGVINRFYMGKEYNVYSKAWIFGYNVSHPPETGTIYIGVNPMHTTRFTMHARGVALLL